MNWKAELKEMLEIRVEYVRQKAVRAWWDLRSSEEKIIIATELEFDFARGGILWLDFASPLGELMRNDPDLYQLQLVRKDRFQNIVLENRDGAAAKGN